MARRALPYRKRRKAHTGKLNSDGTVGSPIIGLPDGYQWVREGGRAETRAKNVARISSAITDVPVEIAIDNRTNELCIIGLAPEAIDVLGGAGASRAATPDVPSSL